MAQLSFLLKCILSVLFGMNYLLTFPVLTAESSDQVAGHTFNKPSTEEHADWTYLGVEDPSHWAMLSKEYLACEAGNRQSPINITRTHHGDHHQTLVFHYQTSQLHEINNGHTIQVSHVTGCRVDLNDRAYKLRQFHFHSPSEHHVEGHVFPMEMHLVHQDEDGHVLVIAVLMEADAQEPVLSKLWKWLPDQVGQEVSLPLDLSLTEILPTSTQHYSYSGSLTTPPCTEGVQWVVLKEPMHVTQQDVDAFVRIIGHNARPLQPRRGRHIDED